MIWFFLAGWIAGAVAVVMFLGWWGRTHVASIYVVEEEEESNGKTGASPD